MASEQIEHWSRAFSESICLRELLHPNWARLASAKMEQNKTIRIFKKNKKLNPPFGRPGINTAQWNQLAHLSSHKTKNSKLVSFQSFSFRRFSRQPNRGRRKPNTTQIREPKTQMRNNPKSENWQVLEREHSPELQTQILNLLLILYQWFFLIYICVYIDIY